MAASVNASSVVAARGEDVDVPRVEPGADGEPDHGDGAGGADQRERGGDPFARAGLDRPVVPDPLAGEQREPQVEHPRLRACRASNSPRRCSHVRRRHRLISACLDPTCRGRHVIAEPARTETRDMTGTADADSSDPTLPTRTVPAVRWTISTQTRREYGPPHPDRRYCRALCHLWWGIGDDVFLCPDAAARSTPRSLGSVAIRTVRLSTPTRVVRLAWLFSAPPAPGVGFDDSTAQTLAEVPRYVDA